MNNCFLFFNAFDVKTFETTLPLPAWMHGFLYLGTRSQIPVHNKKNADAQPRFSGLWDLGQKAINETILDS